MQFKLGIYIPGKVYYNYNKNSASIWIRALQMIEYYRMLGVHVRINKYFKLNNSAIIYRENTEETVKKIKYLKLINKKVYWDTCVNYTELHRHTTKSAVSNCHNILGLVDGVIVPTDTLKEYLYPYNNNVHVMDDPINLDYFNVIKKNINWKNPVLGWSGVSVKTHFLNKFSRSLKNKIILITDKNIVNQNLYFKYCYEQWRYETFLSSLLKVDIAFLPRAYNDPYNSCHSSYKALVFAVLGIPIIANKVPSYVKLADLYDGIVFLEDNNNNIDECINTLKNRELSTEIVRKYYSCSCQAKKFINFLKNNLI